MTHRLYTADADMVDWQGFSRMEVIKMYYEEDREPYVEPEQSSEQESKDAV